MTKPQTKTEPLSSVSRMKQNFRAMNPVEKLLVYTCFASTMIGIGVHAYGYHEDKNAKSFSDYYFRAFDSKYPEGSKERAQEDSVRASNFAHLIFDK